MSHDSNTGLRSLSSARAKRELLHLFIGLLDESLLPNWPGLYIYDSVGILETANKINVIKRKNITEVNSWYWEDMALNFEQGVMNDIKMHTQTEIRIRYFSIKQYLSISLTVCDRHEAHFYI